MAKLERMLEVDFDQLLKHVEDGIVRGSVSASLECSVRVFERYSYAGGNRVSLSVTLFQNGGPVCLSAVASGGSQAIFEKINTWGERAFLEKLEKLL